MVAHRLGPPPFSGPRRFLYLLPLTALVAQAGPALAGGALPTGGQFTAGSGAIGAATGGSLTINQSSARGIIDWNSFSIGAGNKVSFLNGGGATLNRVTGGSLSQIMGSLSATGSLYLINPQGIVIGAGGQVVTGGSFVASSRDVSDPAFMAGGSLDFLGASAGQVTNQGSISALGGDILLIGHDVTNTGSLSAPQGTAGLAAGEEVLYQPVGADQRVFVKSGSGDVTNKGSIAAAQAELRAAGGNVYALAGNNGGIIRATGTATRAGHVWLTADGDVTVAGQIAAHNADGSGGTVEALGGNNLSLTGSIDASAGNGGNGGNVVAKAGGVTKFTGKIAARGGAASGNGGSAEVSGTHLAFQGSVDLSAPHGVTGTLLLDPENLTIQTAGPSSTTQSGGNFTGNVDNSVLTVADLENALATSNVVVQTGQASGTQAGKLTVADSVSWSDNNSLTLSAYAGINFLTNVTIANTGAGNLILRADDTGKGAGTVTLAGTSKIDYSRSTGTVSFYYNPAVFGTPTNFNGKVLTNSAAANQFTAYMLVNNVTKLQEMQNNLAGDYALARGINATAFGPFTPIGSDSDGTAATQFTGLFDGLGKTITGLAIQSSVQYAGLFGAIGSGGVVRNLTLANMTLTDSFAANGGGIPGYAGAIAGFSDGEISTTSAKTLSITGAVDRLFIGGLVGLSGLDAIVQASHSGGTITDAKRDFDLGGLVGWNEGLVENSSSTAAVTGTGSVASFDANAIGGLVGRNDGRIATSFAAGAVSGGADSLVGGLVGRNFTAASVITQSHATGSVTGSGGALAGGLAGNNVGSIENDFATGKVTSGGSLSEAGGLVAKNFGLISGSYATGSVGDTDDTVFLGGLAAWNAGGTITKSEASGAVTAGTNAIAGGLVGENDQGSSVSHAYATGPVGSGSGGDTGGLIGYNDGSLTQVMASGGASNSDHGKVGGLVGYEDASASVLEAYATQGAVSGGSGSDVGGLIGFTAGGTVGQAYATGAVSAPADGVAGGIMGFMNAGPKFSHVYWDTLATGQAAAAGNPAVTGAIGETTAQLQSGLLPVGFATSIWKATSGEYPLFTWQSGP